MCIINHNRGILCVLIENKDQTKYQNKNRSNPKVPTPILYHYSLVKELRS